MSLSPFLSIFSRGAQRPVWKEKKKEKENEAVCIVYVYIVYVCLLTDGLSEWVIGSC